MTQSVIAWQIGSYEPYNSTKSVKFSPFSKQRTTRYPIQWKEIETKFIQIIHEETEFMATLPEKLDDVVFESLIRDTGVVIEPYLIPDELVRFFKEKPLIPFSSPEEERVKPFEEAMYQWAKKKMRDLKQH